ncbi:WD40 repeat-like protein [Gloeophyllum trabeum ATCC 11539]|uniref:WD40 repeat-like protein n=1 Tax=Gloeophyllum trabeum (strain ATCC 11539 / FP-39264 / Madison 617) TaxID=670483 RepID=S7QEU6_GLOTA|nr:WD40 repeat-like protein [Gloeophyllum trabeum ATCC 11539]EPQ57952.1 WD40 repeat-like protein [Gloeophyllum trabeum ATCC 11539]
MSYKLSATLSAHSADVRAVASPSDDLILSASRDTTAIVWNRTSGSSFASAQVFKAGDRFVNALTYIPPSKDASQGLLVAGGQDKIINVFDLASGKAEPSYSLIGHTDNVCALHSLPDGTIISGSWDKTAKVWKDFQSAYDLKGHGHSVWTVLALGNEEFLTGSADKTIKLWQKAASIHTFEGHQDAVRGLTVVPDIGFASCSNDSEIRVWTMGGDVVYTLTGHTSFIYSISLLPDGALVSCGEDRSIRVWRDGELAQTIIVPAVSVWSVSTMPNGDIVAGSSDGVVRVFSVVEPRWAPPGDLKEFDDAVAKQALPAQQIGNVKVSDLPGMEALAQPGTKSGQTKMIKNGDKVEAYQWDAQAFTWQQVGEVLRANDEDDQYKGYDHVWDVDIGDGKMLKLPYNDSENPYVAAQRFLENNNIPLDQLDVVVRFIEQHSNASRSRSAGPSTEFVDPYTGSSRYTGSTSSVPSAGPSSFADPYTGASRYSGSPAPAAPTPAAVPSRSPPSVLPAREPRTMTQANINAMQAKLYDIDEALRSEISTSSLAMYPQELRLIDEAFVFVSQAAQSPGASPSAPNLNSHHVEALTSVLERWPTSSRFPVMDLSRLVVAFSPAAFSSQELRFHFIEALFTGAEWSQPWTQPLSKQRETNILLLLRALANAFTGPKVVDNSDWTKLVLERLQQGQYEVLSPKARVVLATVLYNVSCIALRTKFASDVRTLLLGLIFRVLKTEKQESEAYHRALVALGNVVFAAKEQNAPLTTAQAAEVRQSIGVVPGQFSERERPVVADINGLL